LACTVIVEVVVPSAVIEVGLAVIVEVDALSGPGTKVTLVETGVPAIVAVIVSFCATVDASVAVNIPLPLVGPDAGVKVLAVPDPDSTTVSPEMTFPNASFAVTVRPIVAVPAVWLVGTATIEDMVALTAPGANVTVAECPIALPTIVPVILAFPATVEEVRVAV
jgi:hypothetical protein